jgi:flagellar biosynthesis protein FliR
MTALSISLPQIQLFLFIFLRVSAMTLTVPVFDSRNIPASFKIGLCFTLALVLYPIVKLEPVAFSPSLIPFAVGVACEILTGVIIGFAIRLIFAGIQLAGELAAFQMGFSVASVLDPMSSSQVPVISQMMYMFAILIFLTTNAHHWVLRALVESFTLIPPFGFHSSGSLMARLTQAAGDLFVIAVKTGSPVIVSLLLVSLGLGLVGRTVPQMNVFMVATPVNILIGFLFLSLSLPLMMTYLDQLLNGLGKEILQIMKLMGS